MSQQHLSVGYRRNGKQKACEPCRRGKLACDHGHPFCGRCVRRSTTKKCVYHPAPMTRASVPAMESYTAVPQIEAVPGKLILHDARSLQTDDGPSHSIGRISFQRSIGTQTTDEAPALKSSIGPGNIFGKAAYLGNNQINWKTAVYQRSARYYGPTSFSAVFSEQQDDSTGKLITDLGEDRRKHPGSWLFGEPLLGRERPNTPAVRRTHVIKALQNIPPKETCQKLFSSFESMHDATMDRTMISHCISELWATFGAELDLPRAVEPLVNLSDVLFNNEEMPLPPSPDDGIEWLNTFTGSNLRFEMLGILFCFFGMAYHFLQDSDPLFDSLENKGRDRRQSAWRMKECADVCLNMCDAAETVNFLVTSLIFNVKVLESGCTGDETNKIRRLNSDMVTSAISSGLHRLPSYTNGKLTAASEYKRRLFCAVYSSDKIHSSLNGTPPLLSRLYCDVELFLDLDPKAPYFLEYDLTAAVKSLDVNGWNTAGCTYETTFLRAKVQLATIREEILQLSLGFDVIVSDAIIGDLHTRSQQMYDAFPSQLHYHHETEYTRGISEGLLYEQAYLMLLYLQNCFLLNRVAIARGLRNGQGLVGNALEMLDITLMFWIKRDQLMIFSSGFDWIITYYGVPAAGVICVELLKQSSGQNSVQFPRSDAIQKLTLFIGFLEWIRPTHGNFKLAGRLRNVVKRVLDHVLEQNRPVEEANRTDSNQAQLDLIPTQFEEMGDLEWLNTIDWTQGTWMDFNP